MPKLTNVSLVDQMLNNPKVNQRAIDELAEWHGQQLLPYFSKADLALFYIKNKCDVETTKKNVRNYFFMRCRMPEIFDKRLDMRSAELKKVVETVFIVSLQKRTKDRHRVILARLIDTEAKNYNLSAALKFMNMLIDIGVYENGSKDKYIFVYDLDGANMEHGRALSIEALVQFQEYLLKGSPAEWIGTHYVNTGSDNKEFENFVMENIVNNEKLIGVQFHRNVDELLDATGMDRSMLPKEMGGDGGTVLEMQSAQVNKLESNRSVFIGLEKKSRLSTYTSIPEVMDLPGRE